MFIGFNVEKNTNFQSFCYIAMIRYTDNRKMGCTFLDHLTYPEILISYEIFLETH